MTNLNIEIRDNDYNNKHEMTLSALIERKIKPYYKEENGGNADEMKNDISIDLLENLMSLLLRKNVISTDEVKSLISTCVNIQDEIISVK